MVGVIAGLCTFVLLAKYTQSLSKKNYTPMPQGIILSEQKLIVTPFEVSQEWEKAKSSVAWSMVKEIPESSAIILLKVDSFIGIPIPTRLFSTEEEKQKFLISIKRFWKRKDFPIET